MGELPSRGAYLLSSSSTTNSQRPGRRPTRSLSSNARCRVTPTTNRWARSCRLWRSTTVTWASDVRDRCAGRAAAMSARMMRRQAGPRRQQPADEGVDGAHADGRARPTRCVVVVGDRARRPGRPGRRRCAARRRRSATAPSSPTGSPSRSRRGRDVVDDHRVLLALVLGVGEHERQQLARRRTPRASSRTACTPVVRLATSGPALGSPRRGGAYTATDGERCRRAARGARSVAGASSVSRRVGLVEEQQVLALHVEDQRLGVDRLGARARRSVNRL